MTRDEAEGSGSLLCVTDILPFWVGVSFQIEISKAYQGRVTAQVTA